MRPDRPQSITRGVIWGWVVGLTILGAVMLGFAVHWKLAPAGAICGFAAAAFYLWLRQELEGVDVRRMLPPWMRG